MYQQVYDPVASSLALSALVAARGIHRVGEHAPTAPTTIEDTASEVRPESSSS